MQVLRSISFLAICFSLCLPDMASAEESSSWTDRIKAVFQFSEKKIRDEVNYWAGKSSDKKVSSSDQKKLVLPDDLPVDWRIGFEEEPVYKSMVLVAEVGDPNKQTILLVHGLGQSGLRDWIPVVPTLKNQYHVVMLDLPGFGASQIPLGHYSPTNYAKVIDWLKKKYSDSPVIVVGHSMGGAVALRYAHLYPNDIKHLVLVDVAGILERSAFLRHSVNVPFDASSLPERLQQLVSKAERLRSSVVEWVNQIPDLLPVFTKNDAAWNLIVSDQPNANAALSLIEENFGLALDRVSTRTTIIWGELDKVAPLRTGKLLAEKLPGDGLLVIGQAGHVPMKSRMEAFNLLLNTALSGSIEGQKTGLLTRERRDEDYVCNDQSGVKIENVTYNKIVVNNCSPIEMINVVAQSLKIMHAVVNIENMRVSGSAEINDSVVIATNMEMTGNEGVKLSDSHFDFAGGRIVAKNDAIYASGTSHVILSVSSIQSNVYEGYAHGAYEVRNQSVDEQLLTE